MSQRLERCRVGIATPRGDAGRSTVVRRCTTARESRVSSAYAYGFIVVYAITCASRFTRWLAALDGIM